MIYLDRKISIVFFKQKYFPQNQSLIHHSIYLQPVTYKTRNSFSKKKLTADYGIKTQPS